jgi:hypothetical protein
MAIGVAWWWVPGGWVPLPLNILVRDNLLPILTGNKLPLLKNSNNIGKITFYPLT